MIDAAVRLGKTQVEFERGYYVMDLLDVLEADKRVKAGEALGALNTATMAQTTNVESYRKYAEELQRAAGLGTAEKPQFDRKGYEKLRDMMRAGMW